MENLISSKVRADAHKVAFIIQQYPDKKMNEILDFMAVPSVYINTALWAAQDLGLIAEPNKLTGEMKFLAEPEDGWDFGENVRDLQSALMYSFTVLARRQEDMEEVFLSNWTDGIRPIDRLVAMKHLLTTRKLFEYEITDVQLDGEDKPSTYIFYTLFENAEMQWGTKQFKTDPTVDKKIQPEQ